MAKILYLTQRIPFPPDKGDKITTFNILKHLAGTHEVHVGSFVDDPDDWAHQGELARMCASLCLRPLHPLRSRLRGAAMGILTGQPITLPYFFDRSLDQWVRKVKAGIGMRKVLAYSSSMAQYVDTPQFSDSRRLAHFADIDSDKWRQYAQSKRGAARLVYSREARTLLQYERRIASRFDATTFVAEPEATLFRSLAPESAQRISVLENGVDTDYFDPSLPQANPYPEGGPVVVFTGAMDYWPNVDAVVWFARDILPLIRKEQPDTRFYIVGSRPGADVTDLATIEGVVVTGRVPDVRPYLRHARLAVAPLRMARGTQNKALEALAMALPVVATQSVERGIREQVAATMLVADDVPDYARACVQAIRAPGNPEGRRQVLGHYSWQAKLLRIDEILELSETVAA